MAYLVLLIVVLLSFAGILLGSFIGNLRRNYLLQKIQREHTLIPAYELSELLTPLEFEALCTGRISKQGLAGLVTQALMQNQASTDGNNSIELPRQLTGNSPRIVESIQIANISSNAARSAEPFVLQSLADKGWLIRAGSLEEIDHRWSVAGLLMVCASVLLGVVGIGIIISANQLDFHFVAIGTVVCALAILGILISLFLIGFSRPFHMAMYRQTHIIAHIPEPSRQKYYSIYGLYLYMKVSGMDTMTPDYTSLNLRGLDPLYPYAIAAGLDRKIIRLLVQYNYK